VRGIGLIAKRLLLALFAIAVCVGVIGAIAGDGSEPATAQATRLQLSRVASFREPTHLAQPPGTSPLLFVVEKAGVVRVLRRGRKLRRPFLDIRRRVRHSGIEQGLLSIAFAPDYERSRRFYVAFTDNRDDLEVFEFRRSVNAASVALRGSGRRLLRIPEHFLTHHGGYLVFGPDGHLYIGSGDGGGRGDPQDNAQNKRTLRGKILRIDPLPRGNRAYTTPRTNPFKGRRGRDEIFAMGLRNPWRFSFDRGRLFIGDVGQDTYEEVDVLALSKASGANFGWAAWEGVRRFKRSLRVRNPVFPDITYPHFARCSVIGGYVVRDPSLPGLAGRYLYGDHCTGELSTFRPGRALRSSRILPLNVPALASFAQDRAGHIYAISLDGPVWRLAQR
jgi:glucose/arabinose dehydrogenase